MSANVLVTGANGFIGKALCSRMIAEGWNVRGAVRSLSDTAALPRGIEIFETGSIDANTDWKAALGGVDTVVHLAARVHLMKESSSNPVEAYRSINVAGTRHLAQMAQSLSVRRFVFVSSIKVNGNGRPEPYTEEDRPSPVGPYAISKFEAENALKEIADDTGLEVSIVRPPLVYGPGVKANFLKIMKFIDKGVPLPLANVQNKRSFIYLENLIDAIITLVQHPGAANQTFLISDDCDISTSDLLRKAASAMGKPSRLFPLPNWILRVLAGMTGNSETISRLLDSLIVDTSKIRTLLNWKPPITLEKGFNDTLRWYLQDVRKSIPHN